MNDYRGERHQEETAVGGGKPPWQSKNRSSCNYFFFQEDIPSRNWKGNAQDQFKTSCRWVHLHHRASPRDSNAQADHSRRVIGPAADQKQPWKIIQKENKDQRHWNLDQTKDMRHRVLNAERQRVHRFSRNVPPDWVFQKHLRGHLAMAASEMGRVSQKQMTVAASEMGRVSQKRMTMAASDMGRVSQKQMAMAASDMGKVSQKQMAMAASEMGGVSQKQMAMAASDMGRVSQKQMAMATSDMGKVSQEQKAMAASKMVKVSKASMAITENTNMVKMTTNQDMLHSSAGMTSKPWKTKQDQAMTATLQTKQVELVTNRWVKNGIAMMQPDFQEHQSKKSEETEEPYFLRLRRSITWWEKHAPATTVKLIKHGVRPTFNLPEHLGSKVQRHSPQEEEQALQVLQEYMQVGAVIKNPPGITRHLIPWFVISKQENGKEKLRLISDCRVINQFFRTKHFKLDHWKNIFPYLKKGMWAAKIDLKNAYFHLELEKTLKPYVRVKVGGDIYEFQAACFGISTLPQLWMQVMKVFQKIWRQKGIMCFIYLDDILVLNTSPAGVTRDLKIMMDTLQEAGMIVNHKKSILVPTQKLEHLGFSLNLQDGILEVPKHKLKAVRKELGKILTHKQMTCRKMAAILGNVRSFLMAMPFLRAFTDHMMAFVNQQGHWGWDVPLEIPETLQQEVRDLKNLTEQWNGRPFQERTIMRQLHSDSSNHAWAGIDVQTGTVVQEFWRERNGLHINVKELEAAIQTTKSLAKQGEIVHLSVDNSVAFAYLTRGGGKLPHFNKLMRDFWTWIMKNKIQVKTTLIKSQEDQADYWSRVPQDRGDYKLDRNLFLHLQSKMCKFINPKIDMFASPGNHQLEQFVARHPHWQANRQDALKCNLEDITMCYANPPWTVIADWLNRLWDNPHLNCMMITPYWVGAPWWPLLVKMQCPQTVAYIIPPYHGMFQNCLGEYMRAPKWPLLCTVLSGKHWKPNKYKLKTLTLF